MAARTWALGLRVRPRRRESEGYCDGGPAGVGCRPATVSTTGFATTAAPISDGGSRLPPRPQGADGQTPVNRCKGVNQRGVRCLQPAAQGREYCSSHNTQSLPDKAIVSGLGAFAGNLVFPGLGGVIGGAVAANIAAWLLESESAGRPRVFVSFDFDNDQQLKHLLIGQTMRRDLPFSVVDGSLREAAPEPQWKLAARAEIRRCDLVVILVGPQTHRAHGVIAEIGIAREEGKRIVQLVCNAHADCRRVPDAGRRVAWTQANLVKLFGAGS